jgi:MFS family permease
MSFDQGFVFGPIVFGPASEVFGRRVPLFAGYFAFLVFQIPVAVAQNLETIMLGRFFGGFAASAPLAVVGGALADIWGPIDRAYAICAFAAGAFVGPVAGPIMGG